MTDHLETLRAMRVRALQGGGPERVAQRHARGKLTARERLALLLDDGSFQEMGALATHDETELGLADQRYPGDSIVAGFGKINGRRVAALAQDFTVLGGSFGRSSPTRSLGSRTWRSRVAFRSSASTIPAGRGSRKASRALRRTARSSSAM